MTFIADNGIQYEDGHDELAEWRGKELDLMGVDPVGQRFQLGNAVFALVEDNTGTDAYHGPVLGAIIIEPNHGSKIGRYPLAKVRIEYEYVCGYFGEKEEYRLVDVNTGHVWLSFGETNDHYYAIIDFDYSPPTT